MMDTLVVDEKRTTLLKALANSFVRQELSPKQSKEQHWTADFVKGKGSSQIFLLHGQPGVGKTYTAGELVMNRRPLLDWQADLRLECIAEYTKRPLMTLTCSDIGTKPYDVEVNLEKNFKKATKWGAILLIDEADIYLERRHQTDLTRNSLVAGKHLHPLPALNLSAHTCAIHRVSASHGDL